MPTSVVDINITTDIAAVPEPTFNTVALIGTAVDSPPNANFGEPNRYRTASNVEDDYGSSSDVAVSSNALEQMGVEEWYVIVLEETTVADEALDDGASGTLENAPILGDPEATVSTGEVTFVAGTPDTEITSGVELNPDTGDYYNAETGNSIDYSYVDWSVLDTALKGLNIRLPYVADRKYDYAHIGTLNAINEWADSNNAATVAASINGANVDEQTAIETAHDVFGYVPNGSLLAVAHKSSADVGAYIIGQAATNEPWFDVFYDGDGYPFNTEYYRDANVGDPTAAGTFEGGDAVNQEGPTNVIINKAGTTVLSNSLSTAGSSSAYQFWDVMRTQNYAAEQVETALTSLRLREDRIPFTEEGEVLIEDAINSAFVGDVGGVNDPFAEVDVTVPPVGSLTDEDKANRVYSGITIDATLSGNVHEFTLNMSIGV